MVRLLRDAVAVATLLEQFFRRVGSKHILFEGVFACRAHQEHPVHAHPVPMPVDCSNAIRGNEISVDCCGIILEKVYDDGLKWSEAALDRLAFGGHRRYTVRQK